MKASETYTLVEAGDAYRVEITSGPFRGTLYSYGKVSFRDRNLGVPVLKFQFTIHSSSLDKALLQSLPEFKNLIGDILHDQLELQYSLNERQPDISEHDTRKSSS